MKCPKPDPFDGLFRAPMNQESGPQRMRHRPIRRAGQSLPLRTVCPWRIQAWTLAFTLMTAAVASASLGPPSEVNAQALHVSRIDLSWNEAPGEPDGYRVARQCSTGDSEGYCTLAVLSAAALQYSDYAIQAGQEFHYRIEAYQGPESEAAMISIAAPPPAHLPVDNDPPPEQPLYP